MPKLTWGAELFVDLWAAGMAGGAYFAAFLLGLFGIDRERRLLRRATYIAVPLVLLGVALIIADLGEPLRAFNMYIVARAEAWQVIGASGVSALRLWPPSLTFLPGSPMSLGGWVLILFTLCGLALIAFFVARSARAWELDGAVGWGVDLMRALTPVATVLTWVTFGLAILVMAYTGVVLAVSSMGLWSSTFLLPALFVTSAVCTGVAALGLVAQIGPGGRATSSTLREALTVLIFVQLAVLAGFTIWALAAGVARPLVTGAVGLAFWLGAVVLGLLVPLALVLRRTRSAAEGGFIVAPTLVLVGGLLLRATVIVAGQM